MDIPPPAEAVRLSVAEAHSAVKRARAAGLLPDGPLSAPPRITALREFLIHGAKYAFPAQPGPMTRGVPTARAASPLKEEILPSGEPSPVWPHPEATEQGLALAPLYPSAPSAALADPALYELLALLDALRIGRARAPDRRSAHQGAPEVRPDPNLAMVERIADGLTRSAPKINLGADLIKYC